MTSNGYTARFSPRGLRATALCAIAFGLTGARPLPAGIVKADEILPVETVDIETLDIEAIIADIELALASQNPVTLDWKTMAALNYRTGEMPETLRRLNGVQVRVPGFMVPLEDWEQQVTEFILVPYFGACIHVPPPPPNQMAHVLMTRNRKVEVNLWDPVWVLGTLKIENVESPYGVVGFQLVAERIQPYEG
ncbi:hypothetical protein BH23GEM9_BH23GEM9_25310 [soil metagenome]